MIKEQLLIIEKMIHNDEYEVALNSLFQLLRHPELSKKVYQLTSHCLRMLGEHQFAEMVDQCLLRDKDPVVFFILGVALSRMGLYGASLGPLHRSANLSQRSPEVCLEIGKSLVKEGYFEDAKRFLEWSVSLKKPEVPYYLGILALFRRDVAAAEFYLNDLTLMSKELNEAESYIVQLQDSIIRFNQREPIDLRDWHFVQYGKILLRLSKDDRFSGKYSTGRYDRVTYSYSHIGEVLHSFMMLLNGLDIWDNYCFIAFAGGNAKPIALALSKLTNLVLITAEEITPSLPGIVISDSEVELLKINNFIADKNNKLLFCLSFNWSKDSSILPDIIGYMSKYAWMPWEEQVNIENHEHVSTKPEPRDTESIAEDILGSIRLVQSQFSEQLLQFYKYREKQLGVGKQKQIVQRTFSCESPIPK